MEPQDLLIFRNYSGMEEPAVSTPLGFLSIRNILVFAVFGGLAFGIHRLIMPSNIEFPRDLGLLIIVLLPLVFGMMLAMIKPQFGSADSILLSFVYMMKNQNKKKNIQLKTNKKEKKKSQVLGFATNLKKEKVSESDITQEIICADLDELKSMRIQISHDDGTYVSDNLVKCYIDENLIDTIKTTFDGWVIIKIRPENIGKKQLVIRDENDIIILQKTLHFKKK
jgi:hypothetical protein